jgi:hypothetical protein
MNYYDITGLPVYYIKSSVQTSMANLASTYWNQGRWEAAEELQTDVMETRKKKLGADHPPTLTSMANLATTYVHQGRWEAAEELQTGVMEIFKKKLGADHPDTLTSMRNLAFTWKEQGRDEEAIRFMHKCVSSLTRVLGANHPHTLSSAETLVGWKAEKLDINEGIANPKCNQMWLESKASELLVRTSLEWRQKIRYRPQAWALTPNVADHPAQTTYVIKTS